MTDGGMPPFGVGAVLELHESDYMYGTGALAIRVTALDPRSPAHHQLEWVFIEGEQLFPRGAKGPVRAATVRVAAIKGALRPAGWQPGDQPTAKPAYQTAQRRRGGDGRSRPGRGRQ